MDASNPDSLVKTRFLVISDTHGARCLPGNNRLIDPVDVVIHCGDLTEESKLAEFRATLELMKTIQAPLKLVIAGNHDWTLDTPMFKKKIAEIAPPVDMELVRREYGDFGEAQRILQASAKNEDDDESGIVFMDEGTRTFTLSNGASLTLFASPCTPSADDWGFQYDARGGHQWDIGGDVDVVVTHGPPEGVMDRTATGSRIGCPGLFAAVARAKPRLHCFGHVHRGWGAKLARWRGGEAVGGPASHFEAFDNDRSVVVETLAGLTPRDFDGPDAVAEKRRRLEARTAAGCFATSHCAGDEHPLRKGEGTLFVNAAVQGDGEQPQHLPWVVGIELPRAARDAAA